MRGAQSDAQARSCILYWKLSIDKDEPTMATRSTDKGYFSGEIDGSTLYAVNEAAYEEAGESYAFKVAQRLCRTGECRLCKQLLTENGMVPKNVTLRRLYNAAYRCRNKSETITPGMSVLESVFRVLITNKNEPMSLSEIVGKLNEAWGAEYVRRIGSIASLKRMLDNPNQYRIGQFSGNE